MIGPPARARTLADGLRLDSDGCSRCCDGVSAHRAVDLASTDGLGPYAGDVPQQGLYVEASRHEWPIFRSVLTREGQSRTVDRFDHLSYGIDFREQRVIASGRFLYAIDRLR
jgi:hypothetical protein